MAEDEISFDPNDIITNIEMVRSVMSSLSFMREFTNFPSTLKGATNSDYCSIEIPKYYPFLIYRCTWYIKNIEVSNWRTLRSKCLVCMGYSLCGESIQEDLEKSFKSKCLTCIYIKKKLEILLKLET